MKAFLEEVAEDLVNKFAEDLKDCVLIFNNKRPAAYLQKHLVQYMGRSIWAPEIHTVQSFFASSSNLKVADPYRQFFSLHKVFNDILKQHGETPVSTPNFYPHAKIILSDFAQIDSDLVDIDRLFKELEDIAEINFQFDFLTTEQKDFLENFWTPFNEVKHSRQLENFIKLWRRMPQIYKNFHQELFAQGYTTMGQIYRNLAQGHYTEKHFDEVAGRGKLIFIGFNALSKAEAHRFKHWQKEEQALFYFDVDPYYFNDELQEAGRFLRKNLNMHGLKNEAAMYPCLQTGPKEITVYKTLGHASQAKILPLLLEEGLKNPAALDDTAIILADESLLIPTLQSIPSKSCDVEIPLNITMGFPLSASPIYGLIDLWIQVQKSYEQQKSAELPYALLQQFLAHPLIQLSEAKKINIREVLIKEQLLNIHSDRLIRQKGLLALFFKPLTSVETLVLQLQEVLQEVYLDLKKARKLNKQDVQLFLRTHQELNLLENGLMQYLNTNRTAQSDTEENGFLFKLILQALQALSVPLGEKSLHGLQVMGLLESRNLNFKKIYLLGANEGVLPQSSMGQSFIPDSIRRIYDLPVIENQDAISAYMLYRLVQRAETINFSYNELTDESNSGEMSRFIKQLAFESGIPINYRELKREIRTDKQHFDVEIQKSPEIMRRLQDYLSDRRVLSASQFTKYLANPVDFYYSVVAGIKEPEEVLEVVEANKIGSILHEVMEQFYALLIKESAEISADRIRAHKQLIPELTVKAFLKCIYQDEHAAKLLKGMQQVILKIVETYAFMILKLDEQKAPFKILGLEARVKVPFYFDLNGHQQSIGLYGIIDRVDEKDGVKYIVDYKTGADELTAKSLADCFDAESKQNKALVQTLFYTYVFEQKHQLQHVEPNLYVLRKFDKGEVHFTVNKSPLKGDFLEETKVEFKTLMAEKLAELFDPKIPFKTPALEENYKYSIFKTLMPK